MAAGVSSTGAALQRRMELALGALRGVTLAWAAVVCVVDADSGVLDRPAAAFVLLAVLAVWSVVWTVAAGRRDPRVARRGSSGDVALAVVDTALATVAVAADHVVYDGDHPQSFSSAWPLVAVLATGVGLGPWAGLAAGTFVGAGNLVATAAVDGLHGEVLSTAGTLVLLAAAGWVAGWVAQRLRTTAEVAAAAAARAEVARTLHDGVLQTLAVVQRRSTDDELVALAREQDAELRAFLRGEGAAPGAGRAGRADPADDDRVPELLGPRLAQLGARHAIATHLVVIDPGDAVGAPARALADAASEAVVNAAKHSGADDVWVSVDGRTPSGTTVVVHDEGSGFEPARAAEGTGMASSMRERVEATGGGMSVRSAPGTGTEVTLWVP